MAITGMSKPRPLKVTRHRAPLFEQLGEVGEHARFVFRLAHDAEALHLVRGVEQERADRDDAVMRRRRQPLGFAGLDDGELGIEHGLDVEDEVRVRPRSTGAFR